MFTRSSLVLLSLALPLMAQATVKSNQSQQGSVASFYKAYFLDKENPKNKKSTAKAIALYTAFIASNKDHKLASRAAANCVVLLYSTGDIETADAFVKKHASLMAAAESKDANRNDVMGAFRGFGRGGQNEENPNQAVIDKLMALHEKADDAGKTRLSGAITRLGGARALMMARFRNGGFGGRGGGRGGRGGGRGRRGGGFTKPKIAGMSQEDAARAVERMVTSAERFIDRMAQSGQADEADAIEAKLDKIQDLVDDGKLEEAQKLIDSLKVGGGGGGNQGGRRRRR